MSHGSERSQPAEEDGLARLVETETRIAAALAAVRSEAEAIVRAAREEAAADERRFDEDLAAELTALAAQVAARRDADLANIAGTAAGRSRRLRELPDTLVDRLAGWVAEQVCPPAGRTA
jgi:hypothetical protein